MAKRAAEPKVTRKHIARAERERRQRNIILGTAIAITIAVSALLIIGVGGNLVTPVAVVNGEKISTGEFRGRVRLAQAELINQAIFQNQTDTLAARLEDVETMGQSVLNQMIDDLLIRQEVERRGQTVSEDDVDDAIAEAFGFYPNGTPTPFPTFTPNPTLTALASITPTATEGPTPTASPTITPGLRNQFRAQLYRRKLFDIFEGEVPREQDHVNARHILVDSEETALEVLDLLQEGGSFEELASEHSTDESNKDRGGDLGWFPRGRMVDAFETAVFDAEIGVIPVPIETSFGWHIIEVVAREQRELDEYSHQLSVQTEFNSWLIDEHLQATIEISKNWLDRVPDPPSVGGLAAQPPLQ
jgi:parvulin-like peptidyl-prolyl isomerase